MKTTNSMHRINMTVFTSARRNNYVMRWTDPDTSKKQEKSTCTDEWREAMLIAAELADKVLAGATKVSAGDPLWTDFCDEYQTHVNSRRTGGAELNWQTTRRLVEDRSPRQETGISAPRRLSDLTSIWILRWQTRLRELGLSDNSVATYSARLKAALRWAVEYGMLIAAPRIAVDFVNQPRSRAITLEEFERIREAAKLVRPLDWQQWDRFLRGQWHCGFRLAEIAQLSWDATAPIHIDCREKFPIVVMAAAANKKRKPRQRAITPEFWAVCAETPPEARAGLVFPIIVLNGPFAGRQMVTSSIGHLLAGFGEKAGIVTNPETGKFATSHDTRRGFAMHMDSRGLSEIELQKWMDHASSKTTSTFYHTANAQQLAAKVWKDDASEIEVTF